MQLAPKLSTEQVGKAKGISKDTVKRYIRLTELSPALQEMVDRKELGLTAAVELSYLNQQEQFLVAEIIDSNQMIPTLQQAQQMKKASQKDGLDRDLILSIMAAYTLPQVAEQPPAPPPVNSRPRDQPQTEPAHQTVSEAPKEDRPPSIGDIKPKHERRPRIAEDILRLKDNTRECLCTPELFLSTFAEYVKRSSREIEAFLMPFYEQIFPALLPEHFSDLRRQIDLIHAAADKFYNQVKKKGTNEHE